MLKEKVGKSYKDHKKELLVIGGLSVVIAGTVFGIRIHNRMIDEKAVTVVPKICINRDFTDTLPFEVKSHIRKLPNGMQASPMKELTALEHGYKLKPGETWVEAYVKMNRAA